MIHRDYLRMAAAAVLCVIAVMLFITLAGVLLAPLAHAAGATGFIVDINGEPHLVLNAEAQQRLGQALRGKDAEIADLKAQLEAQHKAECNLI